MLPSRCENAADAVFSTPHSCLTTPSYSLQSRLRECVSYTHAPAHTGPKHSDNFILETAVSGQSLKSCKNNLLYYKLPKSIFICPVGLAWPAPHPCPLPQAPTAATHVSNGLHLVHIMRICQVIVLAEQLVQQQHDLQAGRVRSRAISHALMQAALGRWAALRPISHAGAAVRGPSTKLLPQPE